MITKKFISQVDWDHIFNDYISYEAAQSVMLRLDWLSEYSDEFLTEMGSLQDLIGLHTRQKQILYEELDDANERYNKLVDWEY